MRRTGRSHRLRRALATAEAVALAASVGVLGTAAFVITPRLLEAGTGGGDPTLVPRDEEHRKQMLMLLEALHRCRAVLAVHDRTASPYLDIVLWGEDLADPDIVNEGEVIVLSHSRLLQSLTIHYLDLEEHAAGESLPPETLRERSFGERWRLRAEVQGRVIGTGIADVRFEPASSDREGQSAQTDGETAGYLLALTWAQRGADEADAARALVRLPDAQPR